jgi:hypothetical protein
MSEVHDGNAHVIAEFRANAGRVGGNLTGAPVLVTTADVGAAGTT